MPQLPESGVQVTIEGELLRLLFDFSPAEPHEGEEETDIYDCESVDVTGRTYGSIVAAIVNDRYSANDVQAIMANYVKAIDPDSDITPEKREEYKSEYDTYQSYRDHAKEIAVIVLAQL